MSVMGVTLAAWLCTGSSATIQSSLRTHLIDYVLWCISPAVMIAIATYMLRRKLHRDFPAFFNYLVFEIASFAIQFPLRNWGNGFYVYWVFTGLGILVSLAVVVELVQKVVDETKTLPNWNIALACWCVLAVVALVALWPLGGGIDQLTNGIFLVNRTVRVAQFTLALLMVTLGAAIGISRHTLIFGIAVGFGLFAIVNLGVMSVLSHSTLNKVMLSRVNGAAYVICTFVWLAYVAMAAKEGPPSRLPNAA